MRPPPTQHSNFFSSLKQVEKRLKSEQQTQPQRLENNSPFTELLSSPIEIHFDQPNNNNDEKLSAFAESSEPPQAFLSCSPIFSQFHENPVQSSISNHQNVTETNSINDIEQLVQLLGLSEGEKEEEEKGSCDHGFGCGSCHCEGGFYSKIAGVKGPKCGKEVERLEGWIKYFLNGSENEIEIEPLRLSLLLLGKAAFVSQGEDDGFGGLDFPSTIEDFLMNDPPTKTTT